MMKRLLIQQQYPVAAEENMSNLTSASGEASVSSNQQSFVSQNPDPNPSKKKRKLPGNPDPDADVIALSPKTLMEKNRFVCEICNKGFQRDQNLQLHRRGHNLPWKLRQRSGEVRKKVYVCPEATCVHHDPSRALGDLTGIKKHFCRKHGEKKWKCDKCSKKYAVQSDWKAHSKTCGTREYRCDCGTLFSRRDSFITHRAFCDALAEESARAAILAGANPVANHQYPFLFSQSTAATSTHDPSTPPATLLQAQFPSASVATNSHGFHDLKLKREQQHLGFDARPAEIPAWLACQAPGPPSLTHHLDLPTSLFPTSTQHELSQEDPSPAAAAAAAAAAPLPTAPYHPSHMSATALLQKAAQMGSTMSRPTNRGQMAAHTRSVGAGAGGVAAVAASGFGLDLSTHQEVGGFDQGTTTDPALVQRMMMGSFGCDGSFEHALGGLWDFSREANSNGVDSLAGPDDAGGRGGAAAAATVDGGTDRLSTRDFLGLRALSHTDILSMAGLEPCMSSTSYEQPQTKKPWNG